MGVNDSGLFLALSKGRGLVEDNKTTFLVNIKFSDFQSIFKLAKINRLIWM